MFKSISMSFLTMRVEFWAKSFCYFWKYYYVYDDKKN